MRGTWLDCGCADGSYSRGLADSGVERVVGLDVLEDRIVDARNQASAYPMLEFVLGESERLPFEDESFDGVLLNEVLEHVADEAGTLREIARVLRPRGHLALFSPNRWFPFEGHGLRLGRRLFDYPAPFVPWYPAVLTKRILRARNYWPHELRDLVRAAGLEVRESKPVLPVLEIYAWLPPRVTRWYRRAIPTIESIPILRNFGVSTLIVARKPSMPGWDANAQRPLR